VIVKNIETENSIADGISSRYNMSNIRFIVQGSDAANTALTLKRRLQAEWNVQIDAKAVDTSVLPSSDAQTKNLGFDPDSLTILLSLYTGFKLVVDGATELLETKEKLVKLAAWAETTFTRDHEYLWLEVGGIPYPVKAGNLDDIIKALQAQE
jgi:hypothetical protein